MREVLSKTWFGQMGMHPQRRESLQIMTGLVIKRFFDVLLSLLTLGAIAPLLVLTGVSIRLDSEGPAVFRQKRVGRHGKPFWILKFRTMYVEAPDRGMGVRDSDTDPRVTRLGVFLRRWSLDELPQLVNVLRGDMSLVGPRPDRLFRLPQYTERQERRLSMKPGITGLAQVSGRNAIPWEERYELDIAYVDNWSLWLDFKILVKTVSVVLNGRGVDYG